MTRTPMHDYVPGSRDIHSVQAYPPWRPSYVLPG